MRCLTSVALGAMFLASSTIISGEEIVVESVSLPGASLEQEVTYSTTKTDYEATRDAILERLRAADPTARVNPADGPWKRVETTAKIGISIKDVGIAKGRVHLRQISAAEEALFLFEAE